MTENPYSAPPAGSHFRDDVPPAGVDRRSGVTARQTFLAWEKLRILYVLFLGALTLLLAGPGLMHMRTLIVIAEGTVIANLCFFAGPIIESYIRWLGYSGKWLRPLLFVVGTVFTALLVVLTLLPLWIPDQI